MVPVLKRIKPKHIFVIYGLGLVNFVIFKFFGDVQKVLTRIVGIKEQRNAGYWNIQLVPLRSITSTIESYIRIGWEPSSFNFIGNIIGFVPMRLLIPVLLHKPSFLKTMGLSFAIIVSIEIVQFVTCLGAADIDDVILNMAGAFVGYIVYITALALKKRIVRRFRALN
ncbi:VanZ family protein [Paenibacillus spongiae]|uniref:VanZ family protein n=1 Tax=Paenibacillus spongiae TaxID=2909671 RepID=UPI0035A252C7